MEKGGGVNLTFQQAYPPPNLPWGRKIGRIQLHAHIREKDGPHPADTQQGHALRAPQLVHGLVLKSRVDLAVLASSAAPVVRHRSNQPATCAAYQLLQCEGLPSAGTEVTAMCPEPCLSSNVQIPYLYATTQRVLCSNNWTRLQI